MADTELLPKSFFLFSFTICFHDFVVTYEQLRIHIEITYVGRNTELVFSFYYREDRSCLFFNFLTFFLTLQINKNHLLACEDRIQVDIEAYI